MREILIEILRRTRHEYRRYIGMKDMEKRMAKTEEEFQAIDDSIVGEIPFCADHFIANGVALQDDVAKLEKAMERLGRFGQMFVDYQGCPRGAIGRMGWPGDGILPDRMSLLLREIRLMDAVVDVDGNRWVPVLEEPLNDLIRMAQNAEVQQWIPVSERLPDTIPCGAGTAYSEAVNVLTSGRKVLTAIWDGTDFIADAEFWEAEGEEITHWTPVLLPLPTPPKEE